MQLHRLYISWILFETISSFSLGVMSHGFSCEICKYKVHKRCIQKAINNCKWTTLSSIGKDIIEEGDGVSFFTAQYLIYY